MAINTREKRAAIVSLGLPWLTVSVTVNVAKDSEWRQEAGYSYPGITPSHEALSAGIPPIYWQQQMAASMMLRG